MKFNPQIVLLTASLLACGKDTAPDAVAACDASADSDADGLDDCSELDMGLNPQSEDSDGDGIADGTEVDCGADPNDSAEFCYDCGWQKSDPGTIVATGSEIGDIMENVALVDQCDQMVNFYDFAGEYHIVYLTAAT